MNKKALEDAGRLRVQQISDRHERYFKTLLRGEMSLSVAFMQLAATCRGASAVLGMTAAYKAADKALS